MGPFKPLPEARPAKIIVRAGRKPHVSSTTLQAGTGRNVVSSHLRELRMSLNRGVLGV